MNKHRLALIVIGMLAVAVVAGGFFLGVQPQLDRIAAADKQTQGLRTTNQVQEAKNAALAADSEHLDEYKAQLATGIAEIPEARSQQALVDEVGAAAGAAGVTIESMTFDTATSFSAPGGVDVALPSAGTLVAVPMTLSATGDRGSLENFAANLQASSRIVTVSSSSFTDGRLSLSGTTWVLMPNS
ncbi:type 4a pilus biogenesis protein PilO [Microbacterium sp.]|uniref:type 4a pilus biogenesis protein PilO n=1 Tax=Microbacterium sp. TaxID=51671 RepID=UPI0039E39930